MPVLVLVELKEIAEVAESLAIVIQDEHKDKLPHEVSPSMMKGVVDFLSKVRSNLASSKGFDHSVSQGFLVSMGELVRPSATLFITEHIDEDLDRCYTSHLASIFATLCASTALLMHAVEFEKWQWTERPETLEDETRLCARHCRRLVRALFDEDDQVLVNAWKDAQATLNEMTAEENDEWTTRYVSSMSRETTERSGK